MIKVKQNEFKNLDFEVKVNASGIPILTESKNGDVYCIKCGEFLGMTCDPFRDSYHEKCFPNIN